MRGYLYNPFSTNTEEDLLQEVAQLMNKKTLELVQDFVVEGDSSTIHVLNAVSPAFTSSFPFAKWVVENFVITK